MTSLERAAGIGASRLRALRESGWLGALVPATGIALAVLLQIAFVDGVSVHAVLRLMVVALALAAAITVALGLLLRDPHRGAIATLLLMAAAPLHGSPLSMAALAGIALVAILWDRLPSRRYQWSRVTGGISRFVAILLVVILAGGLAGGNLARGVGSLPQGGGLPPADTSALADPSEPDIYVLLLDGYARADTLLSTFGYDDGAFVSALQRRGFDLSGASHSNYPVTAQTLASMFSMAYLDDIPALASVRSGDPAFDGSYRQAINDNAAFSFLRSHGYQIVATGSGWEQLAVRQSDVYLDGGELNTYEWSVLHETGFASLIQAIDPSWGGDQARSRVESTLAEVSRIASTPTPRPRMVFAHVLAPHPPLVFGPNGEALPVSTDDLFRFDWIGAARSKSAMEGYVGQVEYVNEQVLPLIDQILASARRPTVIVVMSDHGSRLTTPSGTTVMAPEAVRNFFAARTPGHPSLFGDSPTPVNLFRTLADAYLGATMPALDNRSYVSNWGDPLQLIPVASDQL